ncbi:hypothetical protein [Parasitella parasitica]|uniref:tRNA:m(4)X modification enzyme TRM13 n=1 Tax=Parasitella parasitica TaxID=35722 RepID=A0A0B7NK46_9FUNG|nr:hypothetical protein [Parasitella parasitica]
MPLRSIPVGDNKGISVFEKDLKKHMKSRCNARPKELPACHSLNVNCTLPLSSEELEFQKNIYSHQNMFVQPWLARVQLHELSRNDLDSIIDKVSVAYDANVAPIPMEQLTHHSSEKRRNIVSSTKHLDQLSSLMGHMEKNGMLRDKTACFVEFGAGRADLSLYVKKAASEENGEATYLLLDRKSVRNKTDQALLGQSHNKSRVQRQLIDIKDLDLSKVECIADNDKKVVAISKHLCGCATDVSLKCLMNYVETEKSKGHTDPIQGIIIALCCHQLCRYEMYPNQEYLKSISISKTEFERMCKMSSWATCHSGGNSVSTAQDDKDDNDDEHANSNTNDGDDNSDKTR